MNIKSTLSALCLCLMTGGANAALVSVLGGQAINDTDLNITWAANANLAATNTFGLATGVNLGTDIYGYSSVININGAMTWSGAQKWIAAMNASNGGLGYLGYNDWRLPTTTDTGVSGTQCSWGGTDCGYNSTGSEMSHLFYTELGNKGYYNTAGVAQAGWGLVNKGPFSNFQSEPYWSGTEMAPNPTGAWCFDTYSGLQGADGKYASFYALAVRSGQVATVPVPAAVWLFGSGLLGLIGIARRKA